MGHDFNVNVAHSLTSTWEVGSNDNGPYFSFSMMYPRHGGGGLNLGQVLAAYVMLLVGLPDTVSLAYLLGSSSVV